MLSLNNALSSVKRRTEKFFNPQIEKERIATANREKLIDLVSKFPDSDLEIRMELRFRFGSALNKELPENLDWSEIRDLFEIAYNNYKTQPERALSVLSQQLDCSTETVTAAMKLVGPGQQLETGISA